LAFDGSASDGAVFDNNPTATQVTFTGLLPGTEYNVSIATNDRIGQVEAGTAFTEITRKKKIRSVSENV